MEITRHFTVSTYILNSKNELLLHFHKKLTLWLPVGGHIDRDELPTEAAIREAKEESGLDIELLDFDKKVDLVDAMHLIRPISIMVQEINPYHQHIDFGYAARAHNINIKPDEGESTKIMWVDSKTIKPINTPQNVRAVYKSILEELS